MSADDVQPGRGLSDPLVGQRLDRYRILELVARGGMGKVYRAQQENLERVVALKTLDVQGESDPSFLQRFSMEASLCAKLTHPNTVRIFDYGTTEDGVCYIAMEFLEGASLHDAIKDGAPFEPLRAIRLMKQVCGSLAEAHDQGIVHRDLKPGNIILTRHGEQGEFPKVVDFGLVKPLDMETEVTKTGQLLGSPAYMSPEQIQGLEVDARADIYSLGVILYVLLAGQNPFGKIGAVSMLMAHVKDEVPFFADSNPEVEVPASLEWVTRVCLRKDKGDRFASVRELGRALKACELELLGQVQPMQLALDDDGRVVLPEALEDPSVTGMRRPLAAVPPSPTSPTLATLRPRRTDRIAWVLAGLAVALLLGFAVATAVRLSSPDLPDPEPIVEVEPAPEPVPVASDPVPIVHEVVIHTVPPAAQVQRDGVFLGDAPVSLSIEDGSTVTLQLSALAHQAREITLDGTQDEVTVTLPPKPVARPAPEPAWDNASDVRDPWRDKR